VVRVKGIAWVGAALFVGAAISGGTALGQPIKAAGPVRASAISGVGQQALQQVSQCISSNPNLEAVLVVDQSASLQDTDPLNRRVDILADVITSLGAFTSQKLVGQQRRVDLAVSRFAETYEPWINWTTLDSQSAQGIANRIRTDIPASNRGKGTDHPEALAGARGSLAEGSKRFPREVPPCKLMLMFTDGVLDVGSPSENQSAAQQMCRARGVVDGLRSDNASIVTIMLFDRTKLALFTPGDQARLRDGTELLRATAEGQGRGISCGIAPIPSKYRAGVYLEGNADALSGLFGAALAVGSGGQQVAAAGSPAQLRIDAGVKSFRVVALAPQGFSLTAPNGAGSIQAAPGGGGGSIAGASAKVSWAGNTVTIDVPVTSSAAVGSWVFTRSGQTDDFGFFLFSGLQIQLDDGNFVADTPSNISGKIVDAAGNPADLSVFASRALTIKSLDKTGNGTDLPIQVNSDGTFNGTFTPQSESTSTIFDVTLKLTTQSSVPGGASQNLAPVSRKFEFPVRLASNFPKVSPSKLALSNLNGKKGVATGVVTLKGSPDGPTTVRLGAVVFADVEDPNQFAVEGDESDVTLAAGETKTIEIKVTNRANAIDSQVSAEIPLSVESATTAQAASIRRDVALPVTFVSTRPINQAVRLELVALFTLLGILIPLLILWFINWRSARLSLEGLKMARVPVFITLPGAIAQMERQLGDGPLLTIDDFNWLSSDLDRERSWQPGEETIQARTPRNPFGSVRGELSVSTGYAVVSSYFPSTGKNGKFAGIALDPTGQYYVVANEESLYRQEAAVGEQGVSMALDGSPFALPDAAGPANSVAVSDGRISGLLVAYIKPAYDGNRDVVGKVVSEINAQPTISDGLLKLRESPPSEQQNLGAEATRKSPKARLYSASSWIRSRFSGKSGSETQSDDSSGNSDSKSQSPFTTN